MKTNRPYLFATFATGALAALPLVATVLILLWAVKFLHAYLGPDSWFGQLMQWFGFGLTGSEWVSYLMGLAVVVVATFLLGVLVRVGLARAATGLIDTLMQKIPVVRNVYDTVKSLVGLFAQRDSEQLKSMSPVWLHFGGVGGSAALGLLSTPEAVDIGGRKYVAVIIPTAPVPVGGGLLYVPEAWVTPAQIGMEQLTSVYVSMGVTSKQALNPAPPSAIRDNH
jgi:uncharacterized membrane protein